jgi:aminopeptidase N
MAPTKSATARYRLPNTVVPRTYRLTIEPDSDKLIYNGVVEIDIEVRKPTNEVVLNSLDLEISDASLNGIPAKLGDLTLYAANERLTIRMGKPLPKGQATLVLRFAGRISDKARGFYRSEYIAADGSKRFLDTTQFEATSARSAFPCFDEPDLKAVFEVTIVVPDGRAAISNMPIARRDGQRVTFAPTPRMSTYLLMMQTSRASLSRSMPMRALRPAAS